MKTITLYKDGNPDGEKRVCWRGEQEQEYRAKGYIDPVAKAPEPPPPPEPEPPKPKPKSKSRRRRGGEE